RPGVGAEVVVDVIAVDQRPLTQPCGPSDPGVGTHTAAPAGTGSGGGGQCDERSNEQDAAAHANNNVFAGPNLHQRPRAYVADSLACLPHSFVRLPRRFVPESICSRGSPGPSHPL